MYDDAAAELKDGYAKQGENGRDSLLYILDLGLALHSGGKLDESNKYFLKANDLAVIKDYTSISKEGCDASRLRQHQGLQGRGFRERPDQYIPCDELRAPREI